MEGADGTRVASLAEKFRGFAPFLILSPALAPGGARKPTQSLEKNVVATRESYGDSSESGRVVLAT